MIQSILKNDKIVNQSIQTQVAVFVQNLVRKERLLGALSRKGCQSDQEDKEVFKGSDWVKISLVFGFSIKLSLTFLFDLSWLFTVVGTLTKEFIIQSFYFHSKFNFKK